MRALKALGRFVKTTLIGGVLFLLPLLAVVFLAKKAIGALEKVVQPIAQEIPVETVAGVHVRQVLAALLLVAVGFLAGLISRTGIGRKLSSRLEQFVLRKVPGYTLLKGTIGGDGKGAEVALVRFDDNTVLGYIVERQSEGIVTVFVPSAPTPATGTVYYMPESRVERIDVPVADAAKVIMRLGVGSESLLRGKKI